MKPTFIVLIALVATTVMAGGDNYTSVIFSKHSPALKLASYNKQIETYKFAGTISLTGTLYLEFDIGELDRANGEVNFEKFVPSRSELSKLPAVVSGPYAAPVDYISLDANDTQLAAVFGGKAAFARISHSAAYVVSKYVKVILDNYSTSIECDARGYSAHVISIAPVSQPAGVPSHDSPSGC